MIQSSSSKGFERIFSHKKEPGQYYGLECRFITLNSNVTLALAFRFSGRIADIHRGPITVKIIFIYTFCTRVPTQCVYARDCTHIVRSERFFFFTNTIRVQSCEFFVCTYVSRVRCPARSYIIFHFLLFFFFTFYFLITHHSF